ncbi:uncharacterized protein LOC131234891 [Magnolia sinica]|uniref:uncharacterized protein LOC131234891 n=1 Tax=Magnolia sinica TaxID=86752 RepID=UPI002657E84D|nr:uncharacterized protein LOC131234891 [Magnolia sinica]
MEEIQDWESSDDSTAADLDLNLQDWNDEEHHLYKSGSIPKLQFRKDVSKGRWDEKMGLAEVVEKKGGMWTTTGIVRRGKLYCSIEEIAFLAERGALLLLDDNDMTIALKDIYTKVADGKHGCCWESFEAYRHLKLLGYIVGRHDIPWTLKGDRSHCNTSSPQGTLENNGESESGAEENISIIWQLKNMHINTMKLDFDVYLPNSKFRKSSPGNPSFILCLLRGNPPSEAELVDIEKDCKGISLKFCHVEHGRVNFFSFDRTELPVLP